MSLIWGLLYRIYRVFSWLRYWMPRRFSPAGIMVICGLFVTLALLLDTDNLVTYQAFAPLFFLLAISVLFGWPFRGRFAVSRDLPRFGSVGQTLSYRVSVKNLTKHTQHGLVLLENLADTRPSFDEWMAVQRADAEFTRPFRMNQHRRWNPFKVAEVRSATIPPLPPQQEAEVQVELTPLRRGVLRFTGVTVARPDPFGLFRAFSRARAVQSTLILPRRYPMPPVSLPGMLKYQEGGVTMASHVGQSEEFVALRDYRRGDPVRHIHWRSWAKAGKPIVKEFEDEFFVRHALVLDTFTPDPLSEVFEEAVSVAASFACSIQTQESLLDLLFVNAQAFCFTSGRGLAHSDQMLEILASVRPCQDKTFATLEQAVLEHLGGVSGCICVFVAWDETRRNFVEKIKMLGVPVLALVIVEAGKAKGIDPGPMSDDPERFHVLELGQMEQGLAKL